MSMYYDDDNMESCEQNGNLEGVLRRLVGHPVALHLINGRTFRGVVLNVIGNAVRLISSDGCRTLIPFLHISAAREPQMAITSRCTGRGDCAGGGGIGGGLGGQEKDMDM